MTWFREDEPPSITLTRASDGQVCSNLTHTRAGIAAVVVATFGRMPWLKWSGCSGREFAFCAECWGFTGDVAQAMVPGIEIREKTIPARRRE